MANGELSEVGFAEFVSKLVSEMFNAVVGAQFSQEQQLAEIGAMASLSVEEFAERYVKENVDAEEKRRIADARLEALRQMASRGVPRVLVDTGSVNAKLTFELVGSGEAGRPPSPRRLIAPLRRIGDITASPERFALPEVRLVVRQADESSPQASNVKSNVFGEVVVTFKTVT